MNKCLLSIFSLLAVVSLTFACTCNPETKLQKYCRRSAIVIINVGELSKTNDYENEYNVTVDKVIKSSEDISGVERLVTNAGHGMCGLEHISNEKLIVTAYVTGGSNPAFSVNICDVVRTWNNLNADEKADYGVFKQEDCLALKSPTSV
ncbi:metalloproteinase inhibitor 2-like protein [Leptotrombidium deliense]|uniref:Metalloproteinase inhibitor 2-like protein n=1 Tax=Leptotrombidium deliense TaxID=299467 RepID=A0A443S7T8_9ACAR|nr:metalloproteinase inhibitor 2-like protein [Leptotrombidium deliense]